MASSSNALRRPNRLRWWNQQHLQNAFAQFNQQYFAGRLPPYQVRKAAASRAEKAGWLAHHYPRRRLIEIRHDLTQKDAIGLLLHEMAHAASVGSHGLVWKSEMTRLLGLGAPLAESDLYPIAIQEWETPFSQVRFDIELGIIVESARRVTLRGFLHEFIPRSNGQPTLSMAEFLKFCPWAPARFQKQYKAYSSDLRRRKAALKAHLEESKHLWRLTKGQGLRPELPWNTMLSRAAMASKQTGAPFVTHPVTTPKANFPGRNRPSRA